MEWLLLIVLVLLLWDLLWRLAGVRQLFPWQLKGMLRQSPGRILVVDARTPLEFRLFRIPGAVNRPRAPWDVSGVGKAGAGLTVVAVCMTGHRSPLAARLLKKKLGGEVLQPDLGHGGLAARWRPGRERPAEVLACLLGLRSPAIGVQGVLGHGQHLAQLGTGAWAGPWGARACPRPGP